VAETFRIGPLSGDHDPSQFVSGLEALDQYLKTQASQDIKRRIATCFVAVGHDSQAVTGYYTLTATSVALSMFSPEVVRKLPRYPVVPAVLLGRLAVIRSHQVQGLGGILLADALKRNVADRVRRVCHGGGCQGRDGATFLRASRVHVVVRQATSIVSSNCRRTAAPRGQVT